ncbi:hypothetical protein K2Q16_02240 [Patescibacteria group bacterium]|nr:hypothetical protein [Patescibacteria group bacterium]
MIGLSIGIFFTYIQPSFTEVKAVQDTIMVYQEERSKVNAVNIKLNELMLKSEDISPEERKALNVYMPTAVDTVAVQRDVFLIARQAGIELTALEESDTVDLGPAVDGEEDSARSRIVPTEFSVGFTAPYQNIKAFLALLEANSYPLAPTALTITGVEESSEGAALLGELTAEITLTTYALQFMSEAVSEPEL